MIEVGNIPLFIIWLAQIDAPTSQQLAYLDIKFHAEHAQYLLSPQLQMRV